MAQPALGILLAVIVGVVGIVMFLTIGFFAVGILVAFIRGMLTLADGSEF